MNMQTSALESDSPIRKHYMATSNAATLSRSPDLVQQLRQWAVVIFLVAVTYLLLSRYVLQMVQVQGQSMVPTLHDADRCFLNRWIYYMHPPRRGDVVVLKDPSDGDYAVKRVIAMDGDSIFFKGGRVYVNGRELKETYLAPRTATYTYTSLGDELILCGRQQVFVLGDNRGNSFDSRIYGPVPRRNIVGELIH